MHIFNLIRQSVCTAVCNKYSRFMLAYLFSEDARWRICHELSEKVVFDDENTGEDLISPSHSSKSPCSNVKYNEGLPYKYKINKNVLCVRGICDLSDQYYHSRHLTGNEVHDI